MHDVQVLYEDADVLVLDKPAGLIVHGDGRSGEPTLVDWVLEKYPAIRGVGETNVAGASPIERSGIVHRLDHETSGVMVIAKTQESFWYLKKLFKKREVHKRYHLFVYGEMKDERGIIDRPIGRSASDFRQRSAQRGARGELREAITWFRVLARFNGFSFVEAQPRTGRTHQIRVHFKAINHPVVSDKLYAPNREQALGFTRTALHSRAIKFVGREGKEIEAIAEYPPDFKHAMKELGISET